MQIIRGLENIADQIREVLATDKKVMKLAECLYQKKSLLVMGRGYNYATCLEGALVSFKAHYHGDLFLYLHIFFIFQKIKELTYLHSEGILAGELKHGPLALIDKQMPIIMILTRDPVYKVSCYILHICSKIFFVDFLSLLFWVFSAL